jgi:hypothetical protein
MEPNFVAMPSSVIATDLQKQKVKMLAKIKLQSENNVDLPIVW